MNTGLVLSGGGVRGIAHIGAIKALEEHDIFPTHIAGTSSGAIVGALYAWGRKWDEILDFFKTIQIFKIDKFARKKPGFVDTEKFYNLLAAYLPIDDFESLKKPLFITATNILDGSLKVFNKGELIRPILASAAFPGVFTPVKVNNEYYVDGGTLNNFPVDLIQMYCDQIVGVYVNYFDEIKIESLKHSYSVLERAYKIRTANDSILKFDDCDLLICPKNIGGFSTFSLKDIDVIFELGYQAANEALQAKNRLLIPKISISSIQN